MKSFKGLLLILCMSAMAFTGVGDNSTPKVIKDDIFTAIRSIDYTSINVLLSDGLDINTVDEQGNTPLIVATKIGNPRILNIVFSHNPEINRQNKKGMTALMIAARAGHFNTVQKLIARGAEITLKNHQGDTALSLAENFGHNQIATFFQKKRMIRTYSK